MSIELLKLLSLISVGYIGLMLIAWAIAWRVQFFSLVDAAWALGIGMGSAIIQYFYGQNTARSIALALVALFWGIRLGGYLTIRLKKHYPTEDTRYQKLRSDWGVQLKSKTLLFFLFQGSTQILFSLPFLLASQNNEPFPALNEIIGLGVIILGVIGEWVSDAQLNQFKSNPVNKGQVCSVGLWKYSRHPNYFFEWTIWCGIGILPFNTSFGWLALIAPAMMLYFLLFITGVGPSEEQALKTRGEKYRNYQQSTSAFVPWFSKK